MSNSCGGSAIAATLGSDILGGAVENAAGAPPRRVPCLTKRSAGHPLLCRRPRSLCGSRELWRLPCCCCLSDTDVVSSIVFLRCNTIRWYCTYGSPANEQRLSPARSVDVVWPTEWSRGRARREIVRVQSCIDGRGGLACGLGFTISCDRCTVSVHHHHQGQGS